MAAGFVQLAVAQFADPLSQDIESRRSPSAFAAFPYRGFGCERLDRGFERRETLHTVCEGHREIWAETHPCVYPLNGEQLFCWCIAKPRRLAFRPPPFAALSM